MAPHPSLCDTLSPRGEGEVSISNYIFLRTKVTFPSPLGERMLAEQVRGWYWFDLINA